MLGVQHRLALTYALPSGEQQASSLLASALPPARPESAAAEGANMQPAADSSAEAPAGIDGAALGPNVLQWKAEHIIAVDEALVRSWAGSHAALPIALKAASRTQLPPPAEAAADAADAAAGGPGATGVTGEGKRVFDGCLDWDHCAQVFLPMFLKACVRRCQTLYIVSLLCNNWFVISRCPMPFCATLLYEFGTSSSGGALSLAHLHAILADCLAMSE